MYGGLTMIACCLDAGIFDAVILLSVFVGHAIRKMRHVRNRKG